MIKRFFFFFLLLLFLLPAFSQTVAHQRCNSFGKGQNLSNWLEAYWLGAAWPASNTYSYADLVKMKEAGITALRLPVCFALVTDTVAPYYVDTGNMVFSLVDSVITWAESLDMMLIIDNHHQWDIYDQNWRVKAPRFIHCWSVLAQRYKNLNPGKITFELLNEPAFGIQIDSLNELFRMTIDTIRQYTTQHSIIVSPNFSSNGQAFNGYSPLPDTNIIYTWHSYDPYQFTHQGFSWASPPVPLGTTFPGAYDQMLYAAWSAVINWRNIYNKPVFLGEFGTGVFGDEDSRCNWINTFGAKIDSFNMPWFYWDWRWDFSIFSSHTVAADSALPCFKHALHLYGDTLTGIAAVPTIPVSLTPNPATTACNIQVAHNLNTQLRVYALSGKLMASADFYGNFTLQVGSWPKGVYLIQLNNKSGSSRQKLLVE